MMLDRFTCPIWKENKSKGSCYLKTVIEKLNLKYWIKKFQVKACKSKKNCFISE